VATNRKGQGVADGLVPGTHPRGLAHHQRRREPFKDLQTFLAPPLGLGFLPVQHPALRFAAHPLPRSYADWDGTIDGRYSRVSSGDQTWVTYHHHFSSSVDPLN